MSTTVREFFESLETRIDPSKLAGVNARYVFDVKGEGAWTVDVADGAISVREGSGPADATLSASAETLEKIVTRRSSATTAYMTGKLKVRGDLGAVMKLQSLF